MAGEIDTIEILQGRKFDDVIEVIKAQAIEKAIRCGAIPGMCSKHQLVVYDRGLISIIETIKIVEVANLPVQVRADMRTGRQLY